jgi:hypothetical protein
MKRNSRIIVAALAIGASSSASAAPIPEKSAGPPTMSAIARNMGGVTTSLARSITGEPTQRPQKAVLRDLDELIAALEKECQGCKNGIASNRPMKPASDSVPHGGTGGIGDLADPGASEKDWAKLTPRERDRILQSMSEGFPPEYRTVLERYYRRLAEEQSAESGKPAEAP